MEFRRILMILVVLLTWDAVCHAASLRPSRGSLNRQNQIAKAHDFSYLNTPQEVQRFRRAGYLVRVRDSRSHRLHSVSFPYARPEVKLFIERLGQQYFGHCSRRLVVTSLTRPRSHQPPNASRRSVHPTGMALDLRRSADRRCRDWLEDVLLVLEKRGVLEASRERRPPHYHVALFPNQYVGYLVRRGVPVNMDRTHRVVAGESLWLIARRYGLSVDRLRRMNGLPGNTIRPGQVLRLTPPRVHRVREGETLWEIARRYDVSVERLRATNQLRVNRIHPGQALTLP